MYVKCYNRGMKLIVGLGNPEPRYNHTRHNVGFWLIDQYAESCGLKWQSNTRFRATLAERTIANEKVILVKPTTYYNLVGESVRSLADFYKIDASNILIIHDDLALPLGTLRTRRGGSGGGNNGIKSLNAHLGEDTARLRVGVWTDHHSNIDKVAVVLGKLSKDEHKTLEELIPKINQQIEDFIAGDFITTTHR